MQTGHTLGKLKEFPVQEFEKRFTIFHQKYCLPSSEVVKFFSRETKRGVTMNYFDAIERLANEQGVTMTALAEAIGKTRTYVPSYKANGRIPSLTVAAKLAAPLGYGLALVPLDAPDEELESIGAIRIDAPPREQ